MKARSPRGGRTRGRPGWHRSRERSELLALYADVDALLVGRSCRCSPKGVAASAVECCHFAVTGREPYPTAIELEEVRHAMRALSLDPRRLPVVGMRRCPLLSPEGRCRVYASRPFGCRTFFCDDAESLGESKLPRAAIQATGRRIADLSARFAPNDPLPRALVRALAFDGD
ncbi:MAG: YkgJ family cysteine cluster protein [Myxococcota bacterium]|nr:YkgJ family cysteine cluster protein [Myxococcota bacterium]